MLGEDVNLLPNTAEISVEKFDDHNVQTITRDEAKSC